MKRLICIAFVAALTGCKELPIPGLSAGGSDIEPVPLSDTRILFEAPAFTGKPIARAKFTDSWQREEYALFRSDEAQAEIVYLAATARETSLESDVTLRTMIRGWNFNAQDKIAWGEEFQALAAFGTVFVLPFHQPDHACFGFSAEWGPAIDDPETNPTKMVFGYYCELVAAPLTRARLEALVDSIEVSRFAGGNTTSVPVPSPIDQDGGTIGNDGYPFLLARGYTSEGRSFVDRTY